MPLHPPTKLTLLCSILIGIFATSGCALIPDIRHQPRYHNPFPQLNRVAVLPFRNQSDDPTLSGSRVSLAYYNELQTIPGFEVIPLGVVENQLMSFESHVLKRAAQTPQDFQKFAEHLGVDAVLQGAITDFDSYYPPRMTLKVNWYAANPGFHPIPVGYGLPWGTKKEKKIPEWIRLESERELATRQLATQSPVGTGVQNADVKPAQAIDANPRPHDPAISDAVEEARVMVPPAVGSLESLSESALQAMELPDDWPDPQGFIPPPPLPSPPIAKLQSEPIISHMHAYNGNNEDFTERLSEYFYFRDDARIGGWQSYLQRSEDFIRFCCHLHVVDTLAARGGQLESRMILRWPIDRYDR